MADLSLLRSFVAVYRAGSISSASVALGLTQPAVTKQMQALEAQVGRPLFARLARGIAPTAAGHLLAQAAMSHVDALDAVFEATRSGGGDLEGVVMLGGPAELLGVRALPALGGVHSRAITIRARAGLPTELLAELRSGALDLVIATQREMHPSLQYEPLCDEEFVLIAAPHWRLQLGSRTRIDARALAGLPLVSYADDLPILRRYWRAVFDAKLSSRATLVVADLRSVVSCVAAGAGISVVPRYLAQQELSTGSIIELHGPPNAPTNRLWLARTRGAQPSARVSYVRELLLRAATGWSR
jgi:DNA-binding transcriptional LysR family regulator